MSEKKIDQIVETVAKIDKEVALQKAALDTHTKQDEQMYEELKRMNNILQQNTDSLKEHMGNNALLKDMIVKMDERLSPIEKERLENAAVKKYALGKLMLILKIATAVGFIAGAWEWLWPSLSHLIR
jgi:hypothetical protein